MSLTISVKGRQYRCQRIRSAPAYLVTECGNVICLGRGRIGSKKHLVHSEPFLLTQHSDDGGYRYVLLPTYSLHRRRSYLHQLVANSFTTAPSSEATARLRTFVTHKDGDRLNNHIDNLEITQITIGAAA